MPYSDDELVSRLSKVLHAARHAVDETGCEAALHAAARLLTGHRLQLLRLFPPPSNLPKVQELNDRIIALTAENGEREIELQRVSEKLLRAEREITVLKTEVAALRLSQSAALRLSQAIRDKQQTISPQPHPNPPQPRGFSFSKTHRLLLSIIDNAGRIGTDQMHEITRNAGYKDGTISGRLSELRIATYFGVALVSRHRTDRGFEYELTDEGRRVLREGPVPHGSEDRGTDGQHDDADGQHDDADDDGPIHGDGPADADPQRGTIGPGDRGKLDASRRNGEPIGEN